MSTLAFVFPGQGSQKIGMLSELSATYSVVRDCFQEVSDHLGYDLWALVQNGPEATLNQTQHTQVAMLVADVAVYRILQQSHVGPAAMMAGHSLGEYAALVCAGSLQLTDAAALVSRRGQLMQETVPLGQGAMAAIVGLEDDEVVRICKQASTEFEQVTPANYNAVGQVVIAGHTRAVQHAIQLAEQSGARMAVIIPVSVPCHCSLLIPASEKFSESLEQTSFKIPEVPVISNVTLESYQSEDQIRTLLKKQLFSPVRWVETIQLMKQSGIEQIIEAGPGKVLSGLIKRIDKTLPAISVNDDISLELAKRSCV
jgi:[acyl-carrier-protein] S-malonyltransferase